MSSIGDLVITVSSFVFVLLLLALIKIFNKLWWTPIRVQNLMVLQGVKGPSYRFIHGNTKEISNLKRDIMSRSMSLSHDILSAVQPHIHLWTSIYGQIFLQWYGSQPQLIILEPELCKEILNNKDGAYSKKKFQGYVKMLLGEGLGCGEGEKWAKL